MSIVTYILNTWLFADKMTTFDSYRIQNGGAPNYCPTSSTRLGEFIIYIICFPLAWISMAFCALPAASLLCSGFDPDAMKLNWYGNHMLHASQRLAESPWYSVVCQGDCLTRCGACRCCFPRFHHHRAPGFGDNDRVNLLFNFRRFPILLLHGRSVARPSGTVEVSLGTVSDPGEAEQGGAEEVPELAASALPGSLGLLQIQLRSADSGAVEGGNLDRRRFREQVLRFQRFRDAVDFDGDQLPTSSLVDWTRLPTRVVPNDDSDGGHDSQLCSICYDEVTPGEQVFALNCGHTQHRACMIEWLVRKAECPDCRGHVSLPLLTASPATQAARMWDRSRSEIAETQLSSPGATAAEDRILAMQAQPEQYLSEYLQRVQQGLQLLTREQSPESASQRRESGDDPAGAIEVSQAARRAAARRERVRSAASDRLAYIRGEAGRPSQSDDRQSSRLQPRISQLDVDAADSVVGGGSDRGLVDPSVVVASTSRTAPTLTRINAHNSIATGEMTSRFGGYTTGYVAQPVGDLNSLDEAHSMGSIQPTRSPNAEASEVTLNPLTQRT
eukprot:SAG31_NODE_1245_length_9134_cov_6.012064_9_plen_558_part_00